MVLFCCVVLYEYEYEALYSRKLKVERLLGGDYDCICFCCVVVYDYEAFCIRQLKWYVLRG